ncbi:MAG: PLP-dependent aminotransferase family protein [Chitinispirillales bacterium]|jgi:DNA-binding transcriptional MocR family regulator|nr:PLP-dependent aminotransferase family protein [Chitinispirillales bacterium]
MLSFSSSALGMRSSEIRRLLKIAADPSIISFAGGTPASSLLPADITDEIYNGLSDQTKRAAMQYGPTDGYPPLVAEIKKYMESKGINFDNQDLIVTAGGQQAINLVAKVFLDPGDVAVTESPSFIGALAAFKSYGADTVGVPMDNEGIIISQLLDTLDKTGKKAKILYLTPYFHNPAGITYSVNRKRQLMDALKGRDICVLEDDPYGELYFDSNDKKLTVPLKAAKDQPVQICYAGSFAKIFSPGMRLGWLIATSEIADKCQLAKQSIDACSSSFTQVLAAQFLSQNKLPAYLETLRAAYARRAGIMLDSLKKYMPEGVSWTTPKGGFYIWVTLPQNMDSTVVFNEAFANGAAFVIGSAFDPAGIKNDCLRLAFSSTPEDKIEQGIRIIAEAVRKTMRK